MTEYFSGSDPHSFVYVSGPVATATTSGTLIFTDCVHAGTLLGIDAIYDTPVFGTLTDCWFHCVYTCGNTNGSDIYSFIGLFNSVGAEVARIRRYSTGGWVRPEVYDGTTWVTGPGFNATANSKFTYDIHYESSGKVSFYINGSPYFEHTGSLHATADVQKARFKAQYSGTVSEVIVSDSNTVARRLESEVATANGTDNVDGTGSYVDIDEIGLNDSDVLILNAAGQKRSFTSPARTFNSVNHTPKTVTVSARMKRDATGPQNARFYLIIGGTRYYSTTFALADGFLTYQYSWDTNPATGTAWTYAEAQSASLEWGIEALA